MKFLYLVLCSAMFSLPALAKKIIYKWPAPEYTTKGYVVEIFEDEGMEKLLLRDTPRTNKIKFSLDSDVYVRVAVILPDGEITEFSNLSRITYLGDNINLTFPEEDGSIKPKENESKDKVNVPFAWNVVDMDSCSLSVRDKDEKEMLKDKDAQVSLTGHQLKLPPGVYEWDISCSHGEIDVTSDSRLFTVVEDRAFQKIKKKFRPYAFFAVSFGTLTENPDIGGSIEQQQNSPATLGVGGSYTLRNNSQLTSSAYFSYLVPSTIAGGSGAKESTPFEIGLNFYYDYRFSQKRPFFIYGGVDFERFSSFNADELVLDRTTPVKFRQQHVLYATLGLSYVTSVFKKSLLLKASLSQSVYSSGDNPGGVTYEGQKGILFASWNVWGKWSVSTFWKKHFFTGYGDFSITRYGFGCSYSF